MRFILINLFLSLFCSLLAAENAGFIKKLQGTANIIREGKIINLKIADKIYSKDIIRTTYGSSIGIIFKDNTIISLGSNTEFIIEEYYFNPTEKKESFIARITKGTMSCITGLISKLNPDAMKIKVKTASIGIRGTHFLISLD